MKSKKYLKYIHTKACIVTGCEPFGFSDIVAHHLTVGAGRGISQKPSDYRCIPIEAQEHMRLHHVGERLYWEQIGVDPFIHAKELLTSYLQDIGFDIPVCHSLDEIIDWIKAHQ